MTSPTRLPLAQLPTPLERADRLSDAWGGPSIWFKRDDLTGFGLSGNKVRKLEYHAAAAVAAGADTLVTCGAVQSNHCRATALVAARLGLDCVLLLRSSDGAAPDAPIGNHLLQRLAGAEVRFITRAQWIERARLMDEVAAELASTGRQAWTMPAGASDQRGVAAFENAAAELAPQLVAAGLGPSAGDTTSGSTRSGNTTSVNTTSGNTRSGNTTSGNTTSGITAAGSGGRLVLWHASSSGGTTAGLALGVARHGIEAEVFGCSVGESEAELTRTIDRLLRPGDGTDQLACPYRVTDAHVGEGYGRTTAAELAIQVEASRLTGLIWDPTYTGKALVGLHSEIERGTFGPDDTVVFWHTGGGFAVFAHDHSDALDAADGARGT